MITIQKPKNLKKTKNFSLRNDHFRFFKECVSGGAGSHFIQKLIDKSPEFKQWKKRK